jgi:hypothetical protein
MYAAQRSLGGCYTCDESYFDVQCAVDIAFEEQPRGVHRSFSGTHARSARRCFKGCDICDAQPRDAVTALRVRGVAYRPTPDRGA